MKFRCFHLSILFLVLITSSLQAQIHFRPYYTYVTGSNATGLALGDINQDGLTDIAVITSNITGTANDYKLMIYYQDTKGNLSDPLTYKYPYRPYASGPYSIDIGDLNGDTKPDIAISSNDSLVIFYQQNPGAFKMHCTYVGYGTDAVRIGDLNHDGRNDIVINQFNELQIHVYYQDMAGSLQVTAYPTPPCGYVKFEITDLNGDQLNDLVFISTGGYEHGVYYYFQKPDGTLSYPFSSGIGQLAMAHGMAIGNLDGDSKPDMAITSGGNYPANMELHMQQSTGFGFKEPVMLTAYDIPGPVCIYDMNCDGKNEILAAHDGWHAISIYEQGASNIYSSSYQLIGNTYGVSSMNSMLIGDMNGDSRPDIVTVDGNMIIHYNDTRPEPVDTLATRWVIDFSVFTEEANYTNQHTDTINSVSIRTTDSVKAVYTIRRNLGYDGHSAIRNGYVCNFYVNDTTKIDSTYTYWYDTLNIQRQEFYHHVDTLGILGINEYDLLRAIKVYPNPSRGNFIIEAIHPGNEFSMSLLDASGIKIREFRLQPRKPFILDLSSKPKGIYFLGCRLRGKLCYTRLICL